MHGDILLATLYDRDSPDMFWYSYKYEAEKAFASIRPLFEKATQAMMDDIDDGGEICRQLFHMDVKLVDSESNKIVKHFILHVNDDHMMLRPLDFSSKYSLKKNETVLAEFVACEDNADRMWWNICEFKPTEVFSHYKDLFLEASELLYEKQNLTRVQEIYEHLRAENIQLWGGLFKTSDGFDREYPEFTLRFKDDNVYICPFGDCE